MFFRMFLGLLLIFVLAVVLEIFVNKPLKLRLSFFQYLYLTLTYYFSGAMIALYVCFYLFK